MESKEPKKQNIFNHSYDGLKNIDGYAICSNCGCRENTDEASNKCNNKFKDYSID